ncbi:MAG: ribosome assembly factor SBDS [Candidatus Aenigmarchaeota archaeon]|nr:ribosome assembly factor SBDS [Candidatus Aenigmarchaeota archaeon]
MLTGLEYVIPMVTVDKAVIAKIERNNKRFEILVDPLLAYDLRQGRSVSIQNMLAVSHVYADSKKGMRASDHDVKAIFKTEDIEKIAEYIVKHGDVQLTASFKREKVEERKKQIAALISRNAMDPRTKAPHPIERVLTSMEQAGVSIDAFQSPEAQMENVIKAIRPIIPISMDKITLVIKVPAKHSGKIHGFLKFYGIKSESWSKDGSLTVNVETAAAVKDEIIGKVSHMTQGDCSIQ